jgi:CRISPR-associated protein Cas1
MHIVAEGHDPTVGFLHTYNVERPAFVFDLMEPLRPNVDGVVLNFVQTYTFHPADFTIRSDGVCRLNPVDSEACGTAGCEDGRQAFVA